uniref:RRM domain-containing protein n=1 Tax=Brassica campestris TaxID=3711 RepID=A0A3P5YXX0_BRACM|nr:unnamed protein product [Brassica rapa]
MAAITESVDSGVGEGIENSLVKPEESDQVKKLNPEAKEFIPSYKKKNNNQSLSSGDFAITKKQSGVEEFYKKDGSRRRNDYNNQGRKVRLGGRASKAQRDDSIRRTVYVSDIDQTVTEEVLAGLFSSYGQVVDCRICGDPNSVLRFAFVEFSDDQGARAALSVGGTIIGYHPVRVLPSKTAILPVNPTFLPRSEDEREKCTRTIYCTNVDKNATEDDVRIFFESACGEVTRIRLLGDQLHSTRIAFVEFAIAESAVAALNCSGVVLGSQPIRVSPSKTPMRGAIGRRFSNPSNGFSLASIVKHTPFLIQPTSHFSSDGGAGRGRGRGGGSGSPAAGAGQFGFNREPEKTNEPVGQARGSSQSPGGYGHGRGRPIQSDPISPPFSSFVKPDSHSVGRGRGSLGSDPVSPFSPEPPRHPAPPQPHQPRFEPHQPPKDGFQGSPPFAKLEATKDATSPPPPGAPNNISNALGSGAGRGKPFVQNEDNRHIQRSPQPPPQRQKRAQPPKDTAPRPQLSPEEAGRRARSQLSRGEAAEGGGGGVRGRGGGRGRGRGARGRGRGRGGEGWRDDKKEEEAEQEALSVFVGDNADGEKFAKKMGDEIMAQLADGYEDICERALPSTAHDALVDAYDTNLMIECEPEYLMPDFGSNPDIDEKPPMPLRECLEKVKPFIVALEGIKDQEEWEEAIEEVMAEAPRMKQIVDHYSGPDRVTAKKQNEELDRIATTLPQSAPDSVKRFADRVALSLKSNPGWGFDKKYQFMDKLVLEVSQNYK